jgi:hypothetical protein
VLPAPIRSFEEPEELELLAAFEVPPHAASASEAAAADAVMMMRDVFVFMRRMLGAGVDQRVSER